MSATEELEEHTHHAKEPFDKRVAATMAIIAALLAVVSVSGHILTTEELLKQTQAADRWAQYQAKSIRRFSAEATMDMLASAKADQALVDKYAKAIQHYKSDSEEIQEQAADLEKESDMAGRKALRLHFGEVFLEIAIVFSSLAILTKRGVLYWAAIFSAIAGVVVGSLEMLVR